MHCPKCKNNNTKVLDSRVAGEREEAIRRRRECGKCGFRFSTYEEIEILNTRVKKSSGYTEQFDREKLARSLKVALKKGENWEADRLNSLIIEIEYEIMKKIKNGAVSSKDIGDIVLKKLKKLDPIAYLRFASVYRAFEDIREFQKELKNMGGAKIASMR